MSADSDSVLSEILWGSAQMRAGVEKKMEVSVDSFKTGEQALHSRSPGSMKPE